MRVIYDKVPARRLERVCDYLVVLVASQVRVAGALPAGVEVVEESHTDKQSTLLVRTAEPVHDPSWIVTPVSMEDLVLGYMSQARDDRARRLEVVS
jgi:ABC-2 type transport system ATP-binding protein